MIFSNELVKMMSEHVVCSGTSTCIADIFASAGRHSFPLETKHHHYKKEATGRLFCTGRGARLRNGIRLHELDTPFQLPIRITQHCCSLLPGKRKSFIFRVSRNAVAKKYICMIYSCFQKDQLTYDFMKFPENLNIESGRKMITCARLGLPENVSVKLERLNNTFILSLQQNYI